LVLLVKIKSVAMQLARIIQAVILMTIVALAASCATAKEYTSKLFAPRVEATKDTVLVTKSPRFLDIETSDTNDGSWVTTDIITGKDTASNTIAVDNLDNLVKTKKAQKDSVAVIKPVSQTNTTKEINTIPEEPEPVVKISKPSEIRTKKSRE
jgi:hypothetical protein